MTTPTKKDLQICKELLGDDIESFEDFQSELTRRSAVLDFLALYNVAKEDKVVERVKHIIHAHEFAEYKPQQWEVYITRLLGRCLRAQSPSHGAVEKERSSFSYKVYIHRDYPELVKILDLHRLISLDWPWYPYGTHAQRYRQDPQLYWRTRGLADPLEVDAMFASWNQFQNQCDRFDRIQMQGSIVKIMYGNPGYLGRRGRWYRSHNHPTYRSFEAYTQFKDWIVAARGFLENDAVFDTQDILAEHDRSDDNHIDRELEANREREAEFLREQVRALAERREAEAAAVEEQEEREETLADSVFANLRERGFLQ